MSNEIWTPTNYESDADIIRDLRIMKESIEGVLEEKDDTIQTLQTQLETLTEKQALTESQIPTGQAEGSEIYLSDSSNMELESIEVEGKTGQVQTEQSANYLDTFLFTNKTINGITLTVNDDGTLTLNGTATSTIVFDATLKQKINKTNYKLTINKKSGTISSQTIQFFLYTSGYSANKNTAISPSVSSNNVTLDNNEYKIERIVIPNGAVLNNVTIEVMVIASDISYVPFTPASPNPDYKQDVHVVTGECEVYTCNKNWLPNVTLSDDGANISGNKYGLLIKTPILPSTQYILSIDGRQDGFQLFEYDESGTLLGRLAYTFSQPFTTRESTKYFKFRTNALATNFSSTNFLLEEGSTATPYIAHESETYPLSLGNIELCEIGNCKDYIYESGADWYIHKEIGKIVLDGTENWRYISKTGNRYAYQTYFSNKIVGSYTKEYYSNYFKQKSDGTWGSDGLITVSNTSDNTYLFISDISTVSELKNWLKTKYDDNMPVIVYYLQTPTDTKITDPTLIAQLNAISEARTYKNITNITTTGPDLPPILNVVYRKDLDTIINNLQQAVVNS